MIDLQNLEPLPTKRQRDKLDRERLAINSLKRAAAKHKGRNHWANWERRYMAQQKKKAAKIALDKKTASTQRHHERVRLFWSGQLTEYPR